MTNSIDLKVHFFKSELSKNHTIFKLIFLLVLWTLAFYPIFPELIHTWMNHSNNSHGILVPLISLFLIWQKRDELSKVKISISNWGLLIFSISIVIYLLGFLVFPTKLGIVRAFHTIEAVISFSVYPNIR